MICYFFSFFSQCFTLLEDKKDAGKLRQYFSGQECSPCGLGRGHEKKRKDQPLLGLLVPSASSVIFPQTVTFHASSTGNRCEAAPAWVPTKPGAVHAGAPLRRAVPSPSSAPLHQGALPRLATWFGRGLAKTTSSGEIPAFVRGRSSAGLSQSLPAFAPRAAVPPR